MKRILLAVAVIAASSLSASAQLQITQIASVDLGNSAASAAAIPSATFGNNPYALAWDGTDALVAGNGTNAGIVRISAAASATPVYGTVFGSSTSQITSLALSAGGTVYASSASATNAVRSFNATTGAAGFTFNTERVDAVAIDPGFVATPGDRTGTIAYVSNGSGRLKALSTAGVQTYTAGTGAIINIPSSATSWRDVAFDPTTGDLYTRDANQVTKAVRNGNNSFIGGGSTVISTLTQTGSPAAQVQQSIAFMNVGTSKFVIANDNNDGPAAATFNFTDIVKVFDATSGVAVTPTYSFLPGNDVNGFTQFAATGSKRYDFGFSSTNNTLAVTDFAARRLYVFSVSTAAVPEAGTVSLLLTGVALLGGVVLKKRKAA